MFVRALTLSPRKTISEMKTWLERDMTREMHAEIEYEDDLCSVINGIDPKAPTHLLTIPKQVIPRISEADPAQEALLGHLLLTAASVAAKLNLESGFRIVINN